MKKRTLSIFVLLLLLASFCLSGCSDANFDFATSDLSKYVDLSLSDITGLNFKLEGDYPAIDKALADKEFRYLRLNAANSGDAIKNFRPDVYGYKPGWGDYAYVYYDLAKTEGGASIASNLYSTEGAHQVMIGFYEFADRLTAIDFLPHFDNETVSAVLQTLMPISRRTTGTVAEGDVLRVSYKAVYEDGKTYKTENGVRIDTTGIMDPYSIYAERYGMDFVSALFGPAIGEFFSFDTTVEEKDKDGKTVTRTVTYTATIDYVAEESFTTVPVAIPEDAFGKEYAEEIRALNGTTVYLTLFIECFDDYDIPDFDVTFLEKHYGMVYNDPDVDTFMARAYEKMYASLEKTRREEISNEMLAKLAETVFTEDRIKKWPKKVLNEHKETILNTVKKAYEDEQLYYLEQGKPFPYGDLNDYAAVALGYTSEEFRSLDEYAEQVARETTMDRLFIFRIAELAGLRMTPEEIADNVETTISYWLDLYPQATREDILQMFTEEYGSIEWYINITVVYGRIADYIYYENTYS